MKSKWVAHTAGFLLGGWCVWIGAGIAQNHASVQRPRYPPKTGVQVPGIQHDIAELVPAATFQIEGHPDWMAVGKRGIWVTSSSANHVVWMDAKTNKAGPIVTVAKPCSGLVLAFGSLWIPSCGDHSVVRVDGESGVLQATIPAGPADSEGGIAAGAGSIWMATSKDGDLVRIDPKTNAVSAHIRVPEGSFNPVFERGSLWVTSNSGGKLVRIAPATNTVVGQTEVGPRPRFLTVGAGSIWVLNQGDGTIARVDSKTGQRIGVIAAGIPGPGGEIAFGDGSVWATVFEFPITRIDASTGLVTAQWHGSGGDSIRYGFKSVWLSDLRNGKVFRLPTPGQK